ncbi:MAG: hypothetical protein V7641_484 [Blastocatellia bacterium]
MKSVECKTRRWPAFNHVASDDYLREENLALDCLHPVFDYGLRLQSAVGFFQMDSCLDLRLKKFAKPNHRVV